MNKCYEKSMQIARKVIALEVFQKSNKVLLYEPIKSEVGTLEILQEAYRLSKDVYYPRVLGEQMEFYRVDETTEFEISAYGIREPKPESTVVYEPGEKDMAFVIIPGAVFDMEGNRIGYGGGYYDKYLHGLASVVPEENICKVAVAYECQIVEIGNIETESHDVQVDYIVTEERTVRRKTNEYISD